MHELVLFLVCDVLHTMLSLYELQHKVFELQECLWNLRYLSFDAILNALLCIRKVKDVRDLTHDNSGGGDHEGLQGITVQMHLVNQSQEARLQIVR